MAKDLEIEELEDRGDLFEEDDEELEDPEELEDESEDEEVEDESEDEEVEEEIEEVERPKKKDDRIPKSRFNEVIQQREDAKERNLWLEEQLSILIKQTQKDSTPSKEVEVSTYDFEQAEETYVSLIIEGEIAKASKLRAEIDKERKSEMLNIIKNIETSVFNKTKTDTAEAFEENKFSKYVDKVEEEYPFLNDKHDDYNEEAVDTVNTLLAGYVAAGKTKSEGLKLAVAKAVPMYVKSDTIKKSLGSKRTVEAGIKAAKASNSQPVKTKSSPARTVDQGVINMHKISDRDFDKLTDKEKRILRGD